MHADSGSSEATVHVWSISRDSVRHRVTEDTALATGMLDSALFVIVVDLGKPWAALRCLERWSARLDAVAAARALELPAGRAEALRAAQHRYIQRRYAGLADGLEELPGAVGPLARAASGGPAGTAAALAAAEAEATEALPELPEGMLDVNCGVPLVVVGTRSELLFGAAPAPAQQRRANAAMLHLRRFCLARGAGLAFVPSPHSSRPSGPVGGEQPSWAPSSQLLQKYLLHRLYPAVFRYSPKVGKR